MNILPILIIFDVQELYKLYACLNYSKILNSSRKYLSFFLFVNFNVVFVRKPITTKLQHSILRCLAYNSTHLLMSSVLLLLVQTLLPYDNKCKYVVCVQRLCFKI